MPTFSKRSMDILKTCDYRLQQLFFNVIGYYDCTVVCGYRNKEDQDKAYKEKKSKLKWPNSEHNTTPSKAVDVAPFVNGKISWDSRQCSHFAGFVAGLATSLGINIIWGGNWDNDNDISDNKFNDLVHYEIKG